MVEFSATPAFLEGAAVAVISLASILLYVRFVDRRLMGSDSPIETQLAITPIFRIFVAVGIVCGVLTCGAILTMGLAGSFSELLFALSLVLVVCLVTSFFAIQVFFTSISIHGDTLVTRSPLGQREVKLANLTSSSLNDRFQIELSDRLNTVRFCQYVEGKRALLEHIVERAPASATWELRAFLNRTNGGKKNSLNQPLLEW